MNNINVTAIDHIVLNVDDVEISAQWYNQILGMKHEIMSPDPHGISRHILMFGTQKINLRPKTTLQHDWFAAKNPIEGTADLCFLVNLSPDLVINHLRIHNVAVELGPIEKQGAMGKIISVYCRDPDGSLIEISSYI